MTGTTISGGYLAGVTLTNAGVSNPATILAVASISNVGSAAVQATGSIDWTIGNAGTVLGIGAASLGISLTQGGVSAGGTITNYGLGTIAGDAAGVFGLIAATVINQGSIAATGGTTGTGVLLGGGSVVNGTAGRISGGSTGIALTAPGAVVNSGAIRGTAGSGVALTAGGAVSNYGAGGTISGYTTGVSITGAGTVINQGGISASKNVGSGYSYSTISGFTPLIAGVILGSGGITNAATGIITSPRFGVVVTGGGSIGNSGLMNGSGTTTSISGTVTSTVTLGFGAWLVAGGTLDNVAGGTIAGGLDGILVTGTTASTIRNAGVLTASVRSGTDFFPIGSFTNAASGSVVSGNIGVLQRAGGTAQNLGAITAPFGVLVVNAAGSATNAGTITSTSHGTGAGIQLKAGGSATNAAGGYITGKWIGIQIGGFDSAGHTYAPGGTVVNDGTVLANDAGSAGAAVWVKGPGIVINGASGTITGGPFGIVSYNPITVFNHGFIGGSPNAVFASKPGNHDRIVTYPGARFSGQVQGDSAGAVTPNGVLELAGGTLVGTIAGFGSKYTGFSNVIVDAGARWSLAGTVAASQTVAFGGAGAALTLANPGAVSGTITGFAVAETLTLGGITDVASATLGAGNVLTVNETGGGSITLQFDPAQVFSGTSFGFAANASGTALSAPCFAAGTRILTTRGEVTVQALRVGDQVVTHDGRRAAVIWLGHRRTDCNHHPRPWDVWPVRVRAGAFGDGQPRRDLLLSPDHAVFVNDVLIPVRYLINDATIVQERVGVITYWHVELERHDVLLAEGLPAESYLDTGNRGAFENGGAVVEMHPAFARSAWDTRACARLVLDGPALVDARAALLRRAFRLGYATTVEAALTVRTGGQILIPERTEGRAFTFALPADTRQILLQSRSSVPAYLKVADPDNRRLGVAVARLTLDGENIALTDARLGGGWLEAENRFRWTDGNGAVATRGARRLIVRTLPLTRYWSTRNGGLSREMAAG